MAGPNETATLLRMLRRCLLRQENLALALALGIVGAPVAAQATVVKAMSLLEKSEASPVIVHGLVERVDTEWEVFEARVRTIITVKIIESIKGDFAPQERLVLFRGGGQIGDFVQTAPGLSQYEPGEEVILFLEPLDEGYIEIGIGIGKYGVNSWGSNKWVTHAPEVAAVRFSSEQPMKIEALEAMQPEPLHLFLKRVRSYVRGLTEPVQPAIRKGAEQKPAPSIAP